jgi:hypothetical protein
MNPNNPGALKDFQRIIGDKQNNKQFLALLLRMKEVYGNDPEKLKAINEMIRDLKLRMQPGYSIAPPPRLPQPGDRPKKPTYKSPPPSVPGDIIGSVNEAPNTFDGGANRKPSGIMASPNPFDGGTNRPPAPSGTPGKPRPGDAGIDLAEKIEDIKANSQVWTQSITNRIEDLVKAVASGDKRAARDLISDLKIDASEFIRYIADDAGVKKPMGRPPVPIKLPKPQQPSTEDPFKNIVTSPASVKEAYAVRSGKKNIREATSTAIKLAQKYNLTELKQLYSRAVNRRR